MRVLGLAEQVPSHTAARVVDATTDEGVDVFDPWRSVDEHVFPLHEPAETLGGAVCDHVVTA